MKMLIVPSRNLFAFHLAEVCVTMKQILIKIQILVFPEVEIKVLDRVGP